MARRPETILLHADAALVEHYPWAVKLFPKATFIRDNQGTIRFRENHIFDNLFRRQKLDLNEIVIMACEGVFNRYDMMHLYMGLGYSLSGFEEIFGADLDDMEAKGVTFDALRDERHLRSEDVEDAEEA